MADDRQRRPPAPKEGSTYTARPADERPDHTTRDEDQEAVERTPAEPADGGDHGSEGSP